jgi:SnoaL-like domain
LEVLMLTDSRELLASYIQAVGERRLEALPPLLEPDAEFTLGDNTVRGREAFVGAFRRLLPIIERNEIRHLFVEGDEACVVYDFVTSTPVGPVLSVEYIRLRNGRIGSSTLVFERLHWPEVLAALKEREAKGATPVQA